MNRRAWLQSICLVGACVGSSALHGHTPYRQWVVYRKKHLMIGCHRENLETWELAKKINTLLERELPDARSRIARAKTAGRLASLIGTDQLDTAVLSHSAVKAMAAGSDGFEPYGAIALRTVAVIGDYSYVVRAEFPEDHARLLSNALTHLGDTDASRNPPAAPWHQGLKSD